MNKNQAEILFNLSDKYNISDVKKTYRKLAHIHHPDKGGSVEAMQLVNEAYVILTEINESTLLAEKTNANSQYFDVFSQFVLFSFNFYFNFFKAKNE